MTYDVNERTEKSDTGVRLRTDFAGRRRLGWQEETDGRKIVVSLHDKSNQ
jgi:hypothetical protein